MPLNFELKARFKQKQAAILLISGFIITCFFSCSENEAPILPDHQLLATAYYQDDAQWYVNNIPFFECSDKLLEEVYYYRWKMYKAHLRNTGQNQYVVTEFITHMSWDKEPWCTINAASMHHIYEGRWLRNQRFMDGYISYLFQGGNNRNYSESITEAAYARYLVDGDKNFLVSLLDSMVSIYNQWYDHWDSSKNLYYIPAMPDATEFNIASIDASGGKGGFEGGEAFRPTINSYMYGNALAISRIAALKGDEATAKVFAEKAASLRSNVMRYLWNDSMQHFVDRFKQDNEFVHYWDFIRGRELAGMAPWYFNLPSDDKKFHLAWKHITDTGYLQGPFGLRTNEPSYEHYFKQLVFYGGKPSSQWNGPSWPYQTSQAITGMANFLHNYKQDAVSNADYLKQLRLYARQHYQPDGTLNLGENYHPDAGGPIVFWYWSNHYNHSTFNNLIIAGLCGITPSESDTLTIHPLTDSSIKYFYLSNIPYHGHDLKIVYDKDGTKYRSGKGISVWVDNKKQAVTERDNRYQVYIGEKIPNDDTPEPANYALNMSKKGYPLPSASVNAVPDTALFQAIDGKIWYFPEVHNRWTTLGSATGDDWFAIDLGEKKSISNAKLYMLGDGKVFGKPDDFDIEYSDNNVWKKVNYKGAKPGLKVNTVSGISFEKVRSSKFRFLFRHSTLQVAMTEIELYE